MKGVEGDLCLWINQIILSALRQDLSLLRNQSGEQRSLLGKESLACPWVALPSPSQALLTRLCPAGLPVNRAGLLAACNALVSLPCSIPRKAGCAGHEAAELCELWCLVPASSLQGKASLTQPETAKSCSFLRTSPKCCLTWAPRPFLQTVARLFRRMVQSCRGLKWS